MSERPANTLQYRSDGPEDAPVLVLGPELGTTWHMWDRQIPELSRNRRVLRFDLPGHGGSPAEPAHTVGELTDRLVATLGTLGIERFDYAGCSFASALGIDLALRHPHRLAALALLGSAARFGAVDAEGVRRGGLEPVARAVPERWFAPAFASAQPAIVDWAVQMVRSTDLNCFAAACEALAAFDVQADLTRVAAPTLVVVGADDRLTPPAQARALVAGIPDARLAVVPGACHLTPVEQPAAVTDLLVRHFTTPAATATAVRVPGATAPAAGRGDDWPVPAAGAPAGPVSAPGGSGGPGDAAPRAGVGRDDWPVPSGSTPAGPVPGPGRPGDAGAGQGDWPVPPGSGQTPGDWSPVPGPRPDAAPRSAAPAADDWPVPPGSTPAAQASGPTRLGDAAAGAGTGRDDWPVPSGSTPATPASGPARPGDAAPGPRPDAPAADSAVTAGVRPVPPAALPSRPAGVPDDWPVAVGSTPPGTAVPARAAGVTGDWHAPKDDSPAAAADAWPAQAPGAAGVAPTNGGSAADGRRVPPGGGTAPVRPPAIDDWPAPAAPGTAGDWHAPPAGPSGTSVRPMTVDDWPVPAGSTPATDSDASPVRPGRTVAGPAVPLDGGPAATGAAGVPARPSGAADDWPVPQGNAPSGAGSLSERPAGAVDGPSVSLSGGPVAAGAAAVSVGPSGAADGWPVPPGNAPSGTETPSARPAVAMDGRPVPPPGGPATAGTVAPAARPAGAVDGRPVPPGGAPSAPDALAKRPAAAVDLRPAQPGSAVPFLLPAGSGLPAEDDFHELVVARDAAIWARPGLDLRSRLLVTLAALTAGGHLDELEVHLRAALRHGVAAEEVKEVLLQCAVSCSPPAVRAAYAVARRVVAEEGGQEEAAEPQP